MPKTHDENDLLESISQICEGIVFLIKSYKKIELAVWERGCGITLACGTGACASVVAGILNGYIENSVEVQLPGGVVNVVWNGAPNKPEGDVFLSGPAEYVFEAELA